MALNNFPYTDQNITNLDFVLRKLQSLDGDVAKIQEFLTTQLEQYILDNLGSLFLDAVYNSETETLTLNLSIKEE